MPFGLRTQMGSENNVLDKGSDIPIGMGNFGEKKSPL